jgi:hypothetical protein
MIDVVIQMLLFQWRHIQGNIVTCPMNGARFDITTGKKVSDPKFPSIETDSTRKLTKVYRIRWTKKFYNSNELQDHRKDLHSAAIGV